MLSFEDFESAYLELQHGADRAEIIGAFEDLEALAAEVPPEPVPLTAWANLPADGRRGSGRPGDAWIDIAPRNWRSVWIAVRVIPDQQYRDARERRRLLGELRAAAAWAPLQDFETALAD